MLILSLLSNCTYYLGAKPGKKHALNKEYAVNSELRLLTRVYGMILAIKETKLYENLRMQLAALQSQKYTPCTPDNNNLTH